MKTYDWRQESNYEGFAGCVILITKILAVCFLTILMFIVFSCEVEDYCWDCEQIKLHNISPCNTIMKLDTIIICNKTEDEIRNIEQTYTYIICDESSIMECEKQ